MRPEKNDREKPGISTEVVRDRRRSGRKNYTNKFLIAMLRGSQSDKSISEANSQVLHPVAETNHVLDNDADETDQLRAARGIILALFLGLASWLLIGAVVWGLSHL